MRHHIPENGNVHSHSHSHNFRSHNNKHHAAGWGGGLRTDIFSVVPYLETRQAMYVQGKVEAHSCNHCGSIKNTYYIF